MAVRVAVQNDTAAGARGGVIDHPEAAGFTIKDGCLVVWKVDGLQEPAVAAYGAGFWVSATIDE